MGLTQHAHGNDNINALVNLALLTGNIGKPSRAVTAEKILRQRRIPGGAAQGCTAADGDRMAVFCDVALIFYT